jgi:hypothetical protein
MSLQMTSLVMQHYPGEGKLYLLALCLADSANAHGESIFPSVARLAHYSRQSERNVQRQLRLLEESGWLECTERSAGGRSRPSRYRIAPDWVVDPVAWAAKKGVKCPVADDENPDTGVVVLDAKPRQNVVVSEPETPTNQHLNPDTAVSPEQKQQLHKNIRPISNQPGCAEPSDGIAGSADRFLADQLFALVLKLHPNHKPPNWRRWCRELRLMRERDGRTPEQIGALFRWANGHTFWAANILSPGSLRAKWDQLVMQRKRDRGELRVAAEPAGSRACVRCGNGTQGRRLVPAVGWLCNHHIDEHECAHG